MRNIARHSLSRLATQLVATCGLVLLFSSYALAQVSLPNGTVTEGGVDLRVKVLGGVISVDRQFIDGRWEMNARWKPATLEGNPIVSGDCKAYPQLAIQQKKYEGDGDSWALDSRYSVRATEYFEGDECKANRIKALRWSDRLTGGWMEYRRSDAGVLAFSLQRYADRNNVEVSFEYDLQGRLLFVKDHLGDVALSYSYDGGNLVSIKAGHKLQNADGKFYQVKYEYQRTSYKGVDYSVVSRVTDPAGFVTAYAIQDGNLTAVTGPDGRTKKYQYLAGRVISYETSGGGKTTYVYDYDKLKKIFYVRVSTPASASGVKITEAWYDTDGIVIRRDVNGKTEFIQSQADSASRSTEKTDFLGRKTVFVKDEFGNVIKTSFPDGGSTSAVYSSEHGGILSKKDELGISTRYEYDTRGNLVRKTEASGLPEERVTEYRLNDYGQVVRETRKGGIVNLPGNLKRLVDDAVVNYSYDGFGNRVSVVDPLGGVTAYEYGPHGEVTKVTDAGGNVWLAKYDENGHQLAQVDSKGGERKYQYNGVGIRISSTDEMGAVTEYQYNDAQRTRVVLDALGGRQVNVYDELGQLIEVYDQAGRLNQSIKYDNDGRPIEVKDGKSGLVMTEYADGAPVNEPSKITFPHFTREYSYDSRGRVIGIKDVGTAKIGANSLSATYLTGITYDEKGQRLSTVDRRGNKSYYTYDGLGRVSAIRNSADGVVRFYYDQRDNLLAVMDQKGGVTTYDYDANNRKVKEVGPLQSVIKYSYDALGNLTEKIDENGARRVFSYDQTGLVSKEEQFLPGQAKRARSIAYEYNKVGSLVGYTDLNEGRSDHLAHSAKYSLDALQRRIKEDVKIGQETRTFETEYLPAGDKSTQTWPDGVQVGYKWSGAGLLSSVAVADVGSVSYSERDGLLAKKVLYPGGVSREIAVDGFDRIGRIRVKSPSQSDLMVREYSYDQESNVVNLLSERGSAVYEYDKLNRLIGVSTDVLGMPAERYSYDESGNRLTDSRRPNPGKTDGSWAYNDGNQLLESATEDTGLLVKNSKPIAHKYDAAGSLVLKSTPDGSRELFPTDNQRYVYDAQNRLAEVQDLAGNTIASYQYDPMGRRICKTSYRSWDGGGWVLLPSVQTATYFYVDEGLAAEYAADGSGASRLVAEYGWEPGGQWGVSPVWIKTTRGGNSAHEVFFYQNDHLGVPQIVVDTSGLKVWSQKSTAFGELVLDSENLISSNLRLAGQYFDGETGLNYNYFRSYSPKVGAYAQADPLGLAGGGNIYSYADQSPISKVDPLGLATISGSWLKPPQFNITDKGFDGFEFVEPSWSWYGYVKFIRIHAHANGYVNVDVKCKMTDECDEKEWEIHLKIPAGGKGHADVGPNAYAIGAGFLAGPFVGISLNIIIAGVALLQAELDALQKINQAVRPIIQEVQQKGPTKLCGG